MEHPKTLRPENLKSVAKATLVAGYPPKPNQLSVYKKMFAEYSRRSDCGVFVVKCLQSIRSKLLA